MRKQKKSRSTLSLITSFVCLVVLAYSGYHLVMIHLTYHAIDQEHTALRETYQIVPQPNTDDYLEIDWKALLERNDQVVGWVYIPDTNINYPILQGETNDTYLRHDIDGNDSIAGSIFLEEMNSPDFLDLNTIIYGHNMLNNAMFSDIDDMARGQLEEMPTYVYVYLPNQSVMVYHIVSTHIVDIFSDIYNIPATDLDLEAYYDLILEKSMTEIEYNHSDLSRILTLSTCAEADQVNTSRSVVHAIWVREVNLGSTQ